LPCDDEFLPAAFRSRLFVVRLSPPTLSEARRQAGSPEDPNASLQGLPTMSFQFSFRLEQPADSATIDRLHAELFGPERFKRAAYVLRDGVPPDAALSFVATADGVLAASVRLTPITIGGRPALLLGPLVVDPKWKGQGAGRALVRLALESARARGHRLVMLVGDQPYYGPLGFEFLGRDVITMPAWVDPDRVLVAGLVPGALDGVGGAAESVLAKTRA
jgi:predicted N-acetyltransferase YhbS